MRISRETTATIGASVGNPSSDRSRFESVGAGEPLEVDAVAE